MMFLKPNWRIPPFSPLGAKILLSVVLIPVSMASIAFTFYGAESDKSSQVKPRTEQDFKSDLLSGKYNKEQREFVKILSVLQNKLIEKNVYALTGKDKEGKLAPEDIDDQVQELRNQADFIFGAGSPSAKLWKATVLGLTRDGPFVVIHASYLGHQYKLYMFGDTSKEQAQLLNEEEEILFSGNLGPERSLTRWGALAAPSYRLYPTYVTNGTLEIKQNADEIRKLEEREVEAALEEAVAPVIIQNCKQHVLATLKYPASGSFSWFKADLRKVGNRDWVYTDVVKAVNDVGGKLPVRFVCEAELEGQKVRTTVRLLDGN